MRLLLALPLLLVATPAFADEDRDSQVWVQSTAWVKVADRVELGFESVARFGDDADGLYEAEIAGDIRYDLGSGWRVSAGYVRVPGYNRMGVTNIEDRPREQISYNVPGKVLGGQVSARLRVEERWRNTGHDMGVRLRPQIRFVRPFNAKTKTALVLWHESFIAANDTDWGQRGGYERMRNFVGLSAPLTKNITLEGGYLNQYGFGRNGAQDSQDHAASFYLNFAF